MIQERRGFVLAENFFTLRTIIRWKNLPTDVMESLTLEVSRCDRAGCELVSSRLPFTQEAGAGDLQRSLPAWAPL